MLGLETETPAWPQASLAQPASKQPAASVHPGVPSQPGPGNRMAASIAM